MPSPKSQPQEAGQPRFLPSVINITGPAASLDKLEQDSDTKEVIGQKAGQKLKANPTRTSAPEIYLPGDKGWDKAELSDGKGGEATDEKAIHQNFKEHRATKGNITRRYRLNKVKGSTPQKAGSEPQTVEKLAKVLNDANTLPVSGLDVSLDHVVKQTDSGSPSGGPAKISARTVIPIDGIAPAELFKQQACWKTIGAEQTRRQAFKHQGEGVTVVIFDTAPTEIAGNRKGLPALTRINSELVDCYIAMRGAERELAAVPEKKMVEPVKALYSIGRVTGPRRGSESEKTTATVAPKSAEIDHDKMYPYHGLLIASLIRELAPKAKIVLLEVLNDTGETTGSNLTEAIDYVLYLRELELQAGGQRLIGDKVVFNMSLGIPRSRAEEIDAVYLLEACQRACQEGVLIVAAAGNDSYYRHPRNPEEPAAYGYFYDNRTVFQQIIAVAASGQPGHYALYSNQGNFTAPGSDLLMDTGDPNAPGGTRYVYWSGTSFAAPLVSACAALRLSAGVKVTDVKQDLWETATKPARWSDTPELHLG